VAGELRDRMSNHFSVQAPLLVSGEFRPQSKSLVEYVNLLPRNDLSLQSPQRNDPLSLDQNLVWTFRTTYKNALSTEDPKSLVIYSHEKGYPTQKMHGKSLARMGPRSPADSTVTHWIRVLDRGEDIRERASGGDESPMREFSLSSPRCSWKRPFTEWVL
jgi:hypothetical protein